MTEIIGIDHIYIAVTDMACSELFYDRVMLGALGFRKNTFRLAGDAHVQYFNRHFGYVLRPARSASAHDSYSPGLHHLCFRVATVVDVRAVAAHLADLGVEVTEPMLYREYAPDYWATFSSDPDGIRLEVTNYREERRKRHANWEQPDS